jgi:hypothetical protein
MYELDIWKSSFLERKMSVRDIGTAQSNNSTLYFWEHYFLIEPYQYPVFSEETYE